MCRQFIDQKLCNSHVQNISQLYRQFFSALSICYWVIFFSDTHNILEMIFSNIVSYEFTEVTAQLAHLISKMVVVVVAFFCVVLTLGPRDQLITNLSDLDLVRADMDILSPAYYCQFSPGMGCCHSKICMDRIQ